MVILLTETNAHRMNTIGILAFVSCLFAGAHCATFYSCGWITKVDCSRFTPHPYCGTNIVTYDNKCEFSVAHCNDNTLDLQHDGACTDADMAGSVAVAGGEAVFDFFCTSLSKEPCPAEVQKVCASDGRTYINYCEYEKAKCTHRDMTIVSFGDCAPIA